MTAQLSAATVDSLRDAGLDVDDVVRVVGTALAEDLRYGPDRTTEVTVPAEATGSGAVRARADGVVAGLPVALTVLDLAGAGSLRAAAVLTDGSRVRPGDTVVEVGGPLRALLTAERTMLNLLCHLSGVATLTRAWVDAVAGTGAVIRDTRKTTPGLRLLEKYAVRCGGGQNHRLGLGDAVLVKDNHVAAAGGLAAAVAAVRSAEVPVEVECDTVEQVGEALTAGVRALLLDNMSLADLRASVALASGHPGVTLEARGGLSLDNARVVAETGVHYLAVGALTHSAPALDLGLDLNPAVVPG